MPLVEVSGTVNGPVRQVYNRAKDMEAFAGYMPDVEAINSLEKGPGYSVTEWVSRLQGRIFRWVEREEFDDEAMVIRYRQTEGDLAKMEGQWTFTEDEAGTHISLDCTFEFGMPVLAALLNPVGKIAVKKNLSAMLQALKQQFPG